ncbi:hypothetical protein NQZ68_001272 [Dissostichus eleginoides]|nr:hypothetical protein NQZ68_001272 [Dissostichus eleginoides]
MEDERRALPRPSLSVAKTSRVPDKIKSCFLKHTSGVGAINLPDCGRRGGRGLGPPQKLCPTQKGCTGSAIHPYQPG